MLDCKIYGGATSVHIPVPCYSRMNLDASSCIISQNLPSGEPGTAHADTKASMALPEDREPLLGEPIGP